MEDDIYIQGSLNKYLDDLAAKMPAPGGGSASALTAALGVSLVIMVLNYTIGKEKFKEFEGELNDALNSAKDLKEKLTLLIDKDVQAYKALSETFKSQDGTVKEKALKDAAGVPIEICNYSFQAMKLCCGIMDKTNKNLISDIAVAAELLSSAYYSALYNIKINLNSIKDADFVSNIRKATDAQTKDIVKIKKNIIDFSNKGLR
jgi:formiminotetrahydrofolate cyclodeaminase